MRKQRGTNGEAAILLRPVVRWQGELLQPIEINGGAESHLQPIADPMSEQIAAPEGSCDSGGSLLWRGLSLQPAEETRAG